MDLRYVRVIYILFLCVPSVLAQGQGPVSSEHEPPARRELAGIVSRFLASGTPPLVSYRARRVLEASTRGGRMTGSIEAVTWLEADGSFQYQVMSESGSGLIRMRVLVAALDEERRARSERDTGADLIAANYDFRVDDEAGEFLRIRLLPRRHSPRLIEGSVFATLADADLVRVEGRLSKSPSFWTRNVDVARRYARVAGVRVPVEMRSRADVRIVGESTFSMTYQYLEINGHPIDGAVLASAGR